MPETRGTLVLVVGPSGVGKDSLIAGAADRFRGHARIIFARRVIARPRQSGGEDHIAVSPAEFAALRARGGLMLHWGAHGLAYGLPQQLAEALEYGHSVVANVSRTVIPEARRGFSPACVVAVTASREVLARRLAGRGRETAAEIDRRLARTLTLSPADADVVIANDGALAPSVERFASLLRDLVGEPLESR